MEKKNGMHIGAIFDMDGTILDSMGAWRDAGTRYLDTIGVRAEEGLDKMLFTMTLPEAAVYLKNRYRIAGSTGEIVDGINQTIRRFYFFDAELKPGTEDLLAKLRAAGVPMAIATVTNRLCVDAVLKRTGVWDMFDVILTVDDVGVGKDRPDIYLRAAETMVTDPEKTLVFEDALHAVRTANSAGFVTVGVFDEYSIDVQEKIKQESRFYLHDFNDLSALAGGILK